MIHDRVDLEAALREALRQEPAPFGFAEKVLRRAAERERRKTTRMWMAIAAMLALVTLSGIEVRDYQTKRQVAAQKAGHELMAALKITGNKLHVTHKLIRRRMNGV